MMKKLLFIMLMISSVTIYSQEVNKKESESSVGDNIFEKVDILPEYPGGINAFRRKFSESFDIRRINSNKPAKSEAQFVIDLDGNVTDIIAVGENRSMNKEMERVIKTISKTKWKPARLNGEPVKYLFKLPISMNL
jgi:hypothetical protein